MSVQTFAQKLQKAMDDRGLRQADIVRLAQKDGMPIGRSHISQYLSGKVRPRGEITDYLTYILGVRPDYFQDNDEPWQRNAVFRKSHKLDNVLYDVRGPVVELAREMELSGTHILKSTCREMPCSTSTWP